MCIVSSQPSPTRQETSSSTAPTRWTALRTSTRRAVCSSTAGPWTCMRRASSTSWLKGPSTRPSTFWCRRRWAELRRPPMAASPTRRHRRAGHCRRASTGRRAKKPMRCTRRRRPSTAT
ncbi:hypothetical protein EYF80_067758 [Liparis tanakae]|uniref:Uncharacterized protein n=1 Tax=Liparis tanakae TaxID=230148 RepID=A0A4Z2E066_9TELE|nr:hypothetical protein EYF80_067758 [Liparis tanakae]